MHVKESLISYGRAPPACRLQSRTALSGGRGPRPHRNQATERDCEKKRRVTTIRNNVARNAWTYPENICSKRHCANRAIPKSEPLTVGEGQVQMNAVNIRRNCIAG